ncbi:MAG: hypothetical protein AAFY56_16000 [Pseudomonadota bacterium]
MRRRDETLPLKQYFPTQQSLDLAERIAHAQGQSFDREATHKLAGSLYDVMFADLIRILELGQLRIDLRSGVYRFARAFSANAQNGRPAIVLDMVFDHWVFSLTQLVTICAFTVPDNRERQRIITDVSELFALFNYSGDFENSRTRMAQYLLQSEYNGQLLNLTAALARAMIVFVLCHEIAHVTLGHLSSKEENEQLELSADAKALEYFHAVVEYGKTDRETHVHIDPKVGCAPIVLSIIFELYEAWLESRGASFEEVSNHPPAKRRTRQLQNLMHLELGLEGREIVKGATFAIQDLRSWLKLPAQ